MKINDFFGRHRRNRCRYRFFFSFSFSSCFCPLICSQFCSMFYKEHLLDLLPRIAGGANTYSLTSNVIIRIMNYEDDCDDGKMVMKMLFLFGKIVVGLEEPFFEAINSIHTHTHVIA